MDSETASHPTASERKPVLVAFDGSAAAGAALCWATRVAAGTGRPLRVAHVLRWPRPELTGLCLPRDVLEPGHGRRVAETMLNAAVAHCRRLAPAVDVRAELLSGATVELIAELAAGAHLLVLGACGQTAAPRVLLGSSAAELVRGVATPVVIVRNGGGDAGRGPVVVGIDGSTGSTAALRFGLDTAARDGRDLVAVHAWSDLPLDALGEAAHIDPERARKDAAELLANFLAVAPRRNPHVTVRTSVTLDRPAEALLDQAAGAALVVVGRHGRAGDRESPLGSVSHAVVHYAPCPVAVVGPSPQ